MRIFLAGPLFSESERRFNADVATQLRTAGFEVWLAQEAPFIQKGNYEEKKSIFNGDVEALRDSEIVLAILDGIDVDPGVTQDGRELREFPRAVRHVDVQLDHRFPSGVGR